MNTITFNNITKWFKSTWIYWFSVAYLIIVLVMLSRPILEKVADKQPVPEPAVSADHDAALKRIDQLEKLVEKQAVAIKKIDTDNDALAANNRQLEKRLQAHTELAKRMCEYVMVITVDRKIVPRQCLPEYKWTREEGL